MMHQGRMVTNQGRQLAGRAALLAGCAALLGLAGIPDLVLAQDSVAAQAPTAYRDLSFIGSRNLVWIIAQLHLLLAGFVLGVPIFAWLCEIVGWKSGDKRYDKLAKEFTKLLTSSYATTALFGGILLFLLIGFYPKLMAYLTDIFFPLLPGVLRAVSCGDGHALPLLVWMGCHVGGQWEEISYFPRPSPECIRFLHHDRAELLGNLPSQSGGPCRGHGFRACLGRDVESHLVASECASIDRQRGAWRLYLRRLCRHQVFVSEEPGRAVPL